VHWIYDDTAGEHENDKARELISRMNDCDWSFPIYARPISELIEWWPTAIQRHRGWQFRFYKYKFLAKIAKDYDVVGCFDADMLVLAQLDPWFDLAANSKYMLSADHNFVEYAQIQQYDEKFARDGWRKGPLSNFPVLCNPSKWCNVFDTIWGLACSFSEDALELPHFNRAIWECGRTQDIVVLPDAQWNRHWIYHFRLERHGPEDEAPMFFTNPTQLRIQMVHGRWWVKSYCDDEIRRTKENEGFCDNVRALNELYAKVLTQGKLKYDFV